MNDDDQQYVYAIGHPNGFVKIGHSKDPQERLKSLQVSSPYELWVIMQLPTYDSSGLEKDLHDLLSDKHVRGEWYELGFDDYDDLADLIRYGESEGNIESVDELEAYQARVEAALLQ